MERFSGASEVARFVAAPIAMQSKGEAAIIGEHILDKSWLRACEGSVNVVCVDAQPGPGPMIMAKEQQTWSSSDTFFIESTSNEEQ
jgi:hypothetical protein